MAIPLLLLLLSISLVPTSHAATKSICSSYKFTNNKTYTKCTDLDQLGASIHWTYKANGTLSIAFMAPPASPTGWVAWGINPTAESMVGTQALVAFKESNGSMAVKTYNISSYKFIEESPILYETSDLSSVFGSDGNIVLFATLKIGKSVGSLNQVYQVGSSVTNGVPDKHAFNPENLASKAELSVTGANFGSMEPAAAPSDGRSIAPAPPGSPSSNQTSSPGSSPNAAWRSGVSDMWSILVVLLVCYIVRF